MSWKKFLDRLKNILDGLLDEKPKPKPKPKPEPEPEPKPKPKPKPELPVGKERKYVYDVKMDIKEADGLLAFPFDGGKIEGRLFVVGKEEDFSQPQGQTLLVSGVIDKVIAADGEDITGKMGENTVLNPVSYEFSSHLLGYAIDNDKVFASGSGLISSDFERIDNIVISGGGKGSYRHFVRKLVCRGNATLRTRYEENTEK